jgi:hypothetical protein
MIKHIESTPIVKLPMTEPTITCPSCHAEIKLTDTLAAPLIEATRQEFQRKIAQNEAEIAKREQALEAQRTALLKAQEAVQEEVQSKLKIEREGIAQEEARKAKALLAADLDQKAQQLAELNQVLADRDSKLANAQKAQAELIRKQRELDDAKREMNLTIETKVQESLTSVRNKARQEAEEGLKLKVAEREETIAAMQRQIEELKRKSEQGSQQLQGEVLELELESTLRGRFPLDGIEPVPKGEFGGDILHRVIGQAGQSCGTILWESKRAKNWSDGWLAKLRDDQRAAKAEIAVIVSQALPKGVETFDLVEGIWVVQPRYVIPIALTLRQSLIEIAATRISGEGMQTKMEQVYKYLTGTLFRQRIEAIVEKFTDMQADLDKERKAMTRLWAKREVQIRGVIESTAGMWGDLQGIAGRTMVEIEGLELKMLPEGATETATA